MRGQDPQPGCFRPTIAHGDPNEHVFRTFLGILHEYVEVPVLIKNTRIEQFVLELFPRPTPVGFDQVSIRDIRVVGFCIPRLREIPKKPPC